MVKQKNLYFIIETVIVGVFGGTLFLLFNLPLAWMLGPLSAVMLWKLITKRKLHWPIGFRNGGQMILGFSMGLSFTTDSARQILEQFPSMLITTILMVGFGLIMAKFISKVTKMKVASAVMGTTPGGLSQMVILSEEITEAEPTIVTFMQTVRMLTVIFLVPFLTIHALSTSHTDSFVEESVSQMNTSGYIQLLIFLVIVFFFTKLAIRFKCPTPWIIGPLISSALLTVFGFNVPPVPDFLTILAQLCLGIYLGLGMKTNMLGNWRSLLPVTLLSSLLIVGFALLLAYGLHSLYSISMSTAFLCIAPGGLPEMGVTAHTVNADVSMVAAFQLFRVFFILFIIPLFLRKFFGRNTIEKKSVTAS